jgi:hypothetical protein
MRVTLCIAVIFIIALPSSAQSNTPADDFSLTLERIGCLGSCPDYKVTIQSDGTLQYEGRAYVHVEGVRKKKLSLGVVQKLAQRLQEEDFFHWEEKKYVCIDFPETHITATLNGARKQVIEGCNAPGKVLKLASEIEKLTGVKRWI